jgi:molecular chaperone DnaJ
VKVPAGVDTGTRLRLVGEGEHGRRGGPPGDLYVDILVREHETLRRRGEDVYSTVSLSFPQAVFGTTIEVDTLHGREPVEIAAGTVDGTELRLRGKGIQRLGGRGRGDHVVIATLSVPHPRDLSAEELESLRRFAELRGDDVKHDRGVLGRVRDLFG